MNILKFISLVLALLMTILFASTLYDVILNPDEYEKIYRFGIDSPSWSKRSISNYIIKETIISVLLVICFFTNLVSILKKNWILDRISLSIFFILLSYIIYSLVMYVTDSYGY